MDRDQNLMRGLKLADLAIMLACFTFSAVVVLALSGKDIGTIRDFLSMRTTIGNGLLFVVFPFIWYLLFCAFGLYDDLLLSSVFRKAKDVLKATSVGTCSIVAVAVPFQISFIDTTFMLIFWGSASLVSFGIRFTIRKLMVQYRGRTENLRKVLIVGVNSRAVRLARQMQESKDAGCEIIGYVDDTAIHAINFAASGNRIVSNLSGFADYLAKTSVDEVVMCLPLKSRVEDIRLAVAVCEEQGIAYGVLRDFFKLNLSRSTVRQLGEQLVITVHPHAISTGQAAIKRAFDLVFSTILIVILSPVFIVTTILIRLTSSGRVI